MTTYMWEAKAASGRGAELLAWVLAHADPGADVYCGVVEPDRVVVIDDSGRELPDPPDELVARSPFVWPFERISR